MKIEEQFKYSQLGDSYWWLAGKYLLITKLLKKVLDKQYKKGRKSLKILDIGCGEGWTLNYFNEKKWDITGIDFSDSGCKNHNPHLLENLIIGDIYENISKLINSKKYDVVWLDNVLEHVFNPKDLLEKCRKLINKNGIELKQECYYYNYKIYKFKIQ